MSLLQLSSVLEILWVVFLLHICIKTASLRLQTPLFYEQQVNGCIRLTFIPASPLYLVVRLSPLCSVLTQNWSCIVELARCRQVGRLFGCVSVVGILLAQMWAILWEFGLSLWPERITLFSSNRPSFLIFFRPCCSSSHCGIVQGLFGLDIFFLLGI